MAPNDKDLGRLEASLVTISKQLDHADQSRAKVYDKIDAIDTRMIHTELKIAQIEKIVNDMTPTIAEYRSYQERVKGAKGLGRFLWFLGGGVLTAAYWAIQNWDSFIRWLLNYQR